MPIPLDTALPSAGQRRAARCAAGLAAWLACLAVALPMTASLALAADDPAATALLERARLWVARDRIDLALETLQRLGRVAPDHPEALALQAELELRNGQLGLAQAAIERLRVFDANNPEIARLEALLRLEGPDKGKLRDARLMAKSGRTEAAIEAWRALFPAGPPSSDLALEYWQLVAATPNSWAAVQAGLLRLTQQQPDNLRYRFALAEHELSRSPLNQAALRRVIEMGKLPEFARQAQSAWRRAVLRQDAHPQTVTLLREYLANDGADTAVRERLTAVLATLEMRRRLAADPAYQAGQKGQAALEQGDLAAAEALLEQSLAQRPDDADVIGALGSLRLRQGRHAQAQAQFDRAAQLDRERSSKWRSLSRTAQLWGSLREADEALDRGDAAASERLATAALRLDAREPDALLALGRAQWRQGKVAASEGNLRAALRIDPTHKGVFRALVALHTERGDRAGLDRLIATLTPAQQSAFAAPIAIVRRDRLRDDAAKLAAAGHGDEAMGMLRQAIELAPTDAWLRYSLARLHADRFEPELGRALLNPPAQAAQPDAEMLHALALYESQLGNDLAALRALERTPATERSGAMARAQRRLWFGLQLQRAEAAARAGQRRRAASVLREVEAASAGHLELSLDVANAWLDVGEAAHARQLAEQLPWTRTTPVAARLRHAALLRRAGAFDALPPVLGDIAAAPVLQEGQRRELRELRDAFALHGARRLSEQGLPQAALDLLAEPLAELPERAPVLLAHAELLRALGRAKEAVPQYQLALALDPANDEAHQALVATLMGEGERAEAQRWIDERLSQSGAPAADADAQAALAGALVELGQFTAARQAFDAIVAATPGHVRSWRQLAQLDLRAGRPELAIERLQRAAEADWAARAAGGAQRPISRLALATGQGDGVPPVLQITRAEAAAAQAESNAWRPFRPLAGWIEQQSPWWAGALDWRWRSGGDGTSKFDLKEAPLEYARPLGGGARLVLRADVVHLDAGSVSLADVNEASTFGSLLLCQPGCAAGASAQRGAGLALNAAYEREGLHVDLGSTPLGFAVQRPVGGLRIKGDLGQGSYSVEVSSRPVTSSLLSYAGTRDPRTGALWGGVQASGVRLGLSRDDGLDFGAWSSFGLHQLHGKNVQNNLRLRAMGGVYWRVINEDHSVVSVGVNTLLQRFTHNAGEFTFGHGGYYSPQSYRSISLPVSWAQRVGRWSLSLRAALSRSRSRSDSAPFFPTDAALQAAAEALTPSNGITPHYRGGSSSGSGRSLAAALESQLQPQWFIGGRLEIERSEDYAPNRALFYLRYVPGAASLRPVAFPPEPMLPTSEY